jgi:hypothetical protein
MDGTSFLSGDFVSKFGFHELMECLIYLGCASGTKPVFLHVDIEQATGFSLV